MRTFVFFPFIVCGSIIRSNTVVFALLIIVLGSFLPEYILWAITGFLHNNDDVTYGNEYIYKHKMFLLGLCFGLIFGQTVYLNLVLSIIGFFFLGNYMKTSIYDSSTLDTSAKLKAFYKKLESIKINRVENDYKYSAILIRDKIIGKKTKTLSLISITTVFFFLKISYTQKIFILLSAILPTPKMKILTVIFMLLLFFDIYLYLIVPFCELDLLIGEHFMFSALFNYALFWIFL